MAFLGAQLVITLVMVSIIQKVTPHLSFGRWLLCSTGLNRFLHPTDEDLRKLAGIPKDTKAKKGKANGQFDNRSNTFHVPRNLELQLESLSVTQYDILHLRYFTEYQWLIDFSLYTAIVYTISETYHYFVPLKNEVNLSMLWCLLVIFFAFKLLTALTVQYFSSEESIGERSTCIVTGSIYLLIAMIILIVPENTLEVGLDQAYRSFNESASTFLQGHGLQSSGPASKIVVKFFIALTCGFIGAIFTFPGLRMARMHWDSLRFCKDRMVLKCILNLSFIMPFLLVLLWIKPLARDYLTVRIFARMDAPLLSSEAFETIRLALVVVAVLLRFSVMPVYLQAYLNLAYDRIEDLKKEAGRITNVDYQKKITSIFYYLAVVTLQYAAPIIMCLYFALMYKTLGEYTWTGFFKAPMPLDECSLEMECAMSNIIPEAITEDFSAVDGISEDSETSPAAMVEDTNILTAAESFTNSLQSLKSVFTRDVYRGLLGFATWWTCFTWFASTSLGALYQSYFMKS